MLRALDPHSVFFDPQQFEQLKEMEQSEQKGFGTVVSDRARARDGAAGHAGDAFGAKRACRPATKIVAVNNVRAGQPRLEQIIGF